MSGAERTLSTARFQSCCVTLGTSIREEIHLFPKSGIERGLITEGFQGKERAGLGRSEPSRRGSVAFSGHSDLGWCYLCRHLRQVPVLPVKAICQESITHLQKSKSMFAPTSVFAELQGEKGRVKCLCLLRDGTIWSLREAPKGHPLQNGQVTQWLLKD